MNSNVPSGTPSYTSWALPTILDSSNNDVFPPSVYNDNDEYEDGSYASWAFDDDDNYNPPNGVPPVVYIFLALGLMLGVALCVLYKYNEQNNDAGAGGSATRNAANTPAIPVDSPTSTAPPAVSDISPNELRSKVMHAILPEQTVDKNNLQYDPEANSYRWVNKGPNSATNTTCSICLERFVEGDVVTSSACTHAFHSNCIMSWAATKNKDDCPMCRQRMFDPNTYKILEKEIVAGAECYSA